MGDMVTASIAETLGAKYSCPLSAGPVGEGPRDSCLPAIFKGPPLVYEASTSPTRC